MKKILALVLAVLMIAGSMVSVAAFEDVAADNKYAKAINELQTQKVIQGTSETTFTPDALVTRWQMALFMARAVSGITDDANWQVGANLFTDCTQYLGAIQYCYAKGIIKGVTATTFAPDANITLRDGLIMAVRALGYEKEDDGLEASAKKYNVTGANYWVPYYQTADELGLLENLGDLSIVASLTRAQTAQLIYNMLFTVVYAKDDANTNNFTLNDIAFGGKKIVDVDTTKNAWVIETPKYFFGTDSIEEDEEEIVIAWYDEDGNVETDIVEFEELEEYGIDTTKIDEYFGATLELINFPAAEDKDDEPDYADYEYLTNFEKANVAELAKADFDFGKDGKVRIGSKTHYDSKNNPDDKKNEVVFYVLADAADDIDNITFDIVKASDFKDVKDFDAKAYDIDNDGYYEYIFINPMNIAIYEEASAKGAERCGVMDAVKDVTYSETLVEEDIFAYTYDAFAKTVTVKAVIESEVGEITSYYAKTTENDEGTKSTTGYVTIGGEKYTISSLANTASFFYDVESNLGDLELDTAASLRAQAGNNMYTTWEFFAFDGVILDFVKESDEEEDEDYNYILVNDFVDFELKEYVVMSTLIDGEEEEIKVNKIYEWDTSDGDWAIKYNFEKLGYSALADALKVTNIKGIYTYEEGADGMYKLYERDSFKYNMVDTDTQEGYIDNKSALVFSSGKAIDAIDREHMFRLATDTKILLVKDTAEGYEVETVKAKTSGTFSIPVDEDTTFYADKVGYGDPDDDCDIAHGITTTLYIFAEENAFDADDYSIVFVDEAIEEIEHGSATDFGFEEDDDEDEDKYVKFVADENALLLSTFSEVDEIYMTFADAKTAGYTLVPGVYLVNADGIVATNKAGKPATIALADIAIGNNVFELANGKIGFVAVTLKADGIDVYNFSDIRIPGCPELSLGADLTSTSDTLGANVKTLKVRDYIVEKNADTEEYEVVSVVDKTNAKLVDYLEDVDNGYATNGATVILVGNDKSDRNGDSKYTNDRVAYPDNTLCGIIINNLKLVG